MLRVLAATPDRWVPQDLKDRRANGVFRENAARKELKGPRVNEDSRANEDLPDRTLRQTSSGRNAMPQPHSLTVRSKSNVRGWPTPRSTP